MFLNDQEREWIDKYGFTVSTNSWAEFVLIDPQLPRGQNKFLGKDLHSLMLKAMDARRARGITVTTKATIPKITTKIRKQLLHGKVFHIKKLFVEDETLTAPQLLAKLEGIGMPSTMSVVAMVRSEMIESLRVLRECNALNC